MIKAVLFDVDGTIIPLDYVVEGIKKTSKKMGLKELTKEEIYSKIVGHTLTERLKNIYKNLTDKDVEKFRKIYHEEYKKIIEKPFPNTISTIKKLKQMNLKIGIVTTKSRETATEALKESKIPFEALVTSSDVENIKPSPEPVLKACKKLGVKPEEAVMIGDHIFDMQSAKNAGATAIGVTTGASTRQELEKEADYVIDEISEAIEVIEKIKQKQDEEQELEETFDIINIPKDRVAVLIGKKGETKKAIEKQTDTKIEISSDGEVIIRRKINTQDPLKQLKAHEIIKAIARGFSPEKAFKLLKPENYLEIISLTEHVSDKSLKRVRSRIIGKEGKARKFISRLTKTEIVIYGKTVSIIGKIENNQIAKKAIMKIVEGAPHSAVFRFLERNRIKIK